MTELAVEPLDPQSDMGRRVARDLTALLLDVEERLEQEAARERARSRD
jgi:hypothetical protein